MAVVVVANLSQVMAAFDAEERALHDAVQKAVGQAGSAVERQAKLNAKTGVRSRVKTKTGWRYVPKGHIAGTGPGPNKVTGYLQGSIRTTVRYGFGTYIAEVGAFAEYARAVELGSPRWRSGVKYPYLGPAAEMLERNGTIERTFTRALTRAIGR